MIGRWIELIFFWNIKGGVLDYVEDGYPDVHLVDYLSKGIGFGKFKKSCFGRFMRDLGGRFCSVDYYCNYY